MKNRWQDGLTALMLLAAVGLLIGAGVKRSNRPQIPPVDLEQNIDVRPAEVVSPEHFTFEGPLPDTSPGRLLALFVITGKVCPPCLAELSDYVELLADVELNDAVIDPLALVFEEDPEAARRFLGTSALPLPGAFGYPTGLAELLGSHPKGIVLQQLVFIDTSTETLFYRTLLPSAITPIEHKQDILGRMVAAYDRQRTGT